MARHVPCIQPKYQFDIVWRDQNEVASRGVRRRLKARDNASRDSSPGSVGSDLSRQSLSSTPRLLPQDYESNAISFFFDSYILTARDPALQNGWLDCVHPTWKQAGPSTVLKPALHAVALCLLEAWSFLNPNSPHSLARSHYLQGVQAVRKRLQEPGDITDDLILATLMLDMYEAVTAFCGARMHEGPHVTGTRALIKNRQKPSFNNEISQRILLGLRGYIVGRAMRSRQSVSDDVSTWSNITQLVPKNAGYALEVLDIEIANLQASIIGFKSRCEDANLIASDNLAQARRLDQQLVDWIELIPEDWTPTLMSGSEYIPSTIRDASLYQPHCNVYRSIFVANTLNGYCCSRIKVQLMILECLNLVTAPPSDTTRWTACQIIQDQADSICASVPLFL